MFYLTEKSKQQDTIIRAGRAAFFTCVPCFFTCVHSIELFRQPDEKRSGEPSAQYAVLQKQSQATHVPKRIKV